MSRRTPRRPQNPAGYSGTDLSGVRDTGLTVRPRRSARRRSPYPVMTVVVAVVGVAVLGWMLSWDRPEPARESAPPAAVAAVVKDVEPERDPTPLFAQQGDMQIHLAIDPGELTALGFHQASGDYALSMTALVPDADMALAAELKAVPPVDGGDNPDDQVWAGACLRMWRSNRGGQPDSAVDMGADPGTPVWAPVSGTVIDVRPYLLYDTYEDFEIHIRPEGREDIDAVLIHVQDVKIEPGDRVIGGVTQLASVRKMSDKIDIQLAGYTANGGDHVHLQFNQIPPAGAVAEPGGS